MKKTIALALTTAALIGIAAPSLAAPFGDGSKEMRDLRAWGIETSLQHNGVAVTGVEEWGDYVRAYVRTADGSEIMEFFDPVTLEQVQP